MYTPEKVFVFTDPHGEADKFFNAFEKVYPEIGPNDHIVGGGDYLNRGLQVPALLMMMLDIKKEFGERAHFLEGNHEIMFKQWIEAKVHWNQYLEETIWKWKVAYGLPDRGRDSIKASMQKEGVLDFLYSLKPYYETPDLLVTHCPITQRKADFLNLDLYRDDYENRFEYTNFTHWLDRIGDDFFWMFVDVEGEKLDGMEKYMISGHQAELGAPRIFDHRAHIDTGAGKHRKGQVTIFEFPSKRWWQSEGK